MHKCGQRRACSRFFGSSDDILPLERFQPAFCQLQPLRSSHPFTTRRKRVLFSGTARTAVLVLPAASTGTRFISSYFVHLFLTCSASKIPDVAEDSRSCVDICRDHESGRELMQQYLYFRPEPQGQGSFLPIFFEAIPGIAAWCIPSTVFLNNR